MILIVFAWILSYYKKEVGDLDENIKKEDIVELMANLDDMTGEEIGFAIDMLFNNGALDVFVIPIQMKKNRPGVLLTCICRVDDDDKMARLMLKHTTTFGVRKKLCERYTLSREFTSIKTKLGDVRVKRASGYGVNKFKYEYEDIAAIARDNGMSISQVYFEIEKEKENNNDRL